ncbi:glycoside hydrolase family 127 protein [Streptomyces sp. NPDC004059]
MAQSPIRATATDPAGPLQAGPDARLALRPAASARITGGLWQQRRAVNARTSIPDGFARLEQAGNLHDLRLAAGTTTGAYTNDLPFMDSDVYKWLEAVAWAESEGADERLESQVDQLTALLADAQEPRGYLQSYFQVVRPDDRFVDLRWGHELYCAGHLIQAAVAHARTTGRTDLLAIARRVADHVDATFGPGRNEGVCGHPEIETALVELYRHTGERRYLTLAQFFVDRRGHRVLGEDRFGAPYRQDHTPVREAEEVAGHAVRQLYLLAGVVDVGVETGDGELLAAAERLWEDMVATKTYLTGGIGSHHTDESFGDSYELPSERAYCETCAAIASIQFSWRLLLATGRARYADLIERTLYNGFLSGVSLSGDHYLYVNPLQVRDGHARRGGDHTPLRTPWFRCACCPPNVMRLLASLQHYVAAGDDTGLTVHQYMPGAYASDTGSGSGSGSGRVGSRWPPTTRGRAASRSRSPSPPTRPGR